MKSSYSLKSPINAVGSTAPVMTVHAHSRVTASVAAAAQHLWAESGEVIAWLLLCYDFFFHLQLAVVWPLSF